MARTRFNRKLKRRQLANTSSEGQDELWTLDKRAIGKSPKSSKRKLRRTRKQNPSLTSHHENRKKGAVAAERSSSSATTVRWLAVEETKSQPTVLTVDSSDEDEQDDECKIEFFGAGRSPHQKPKRPAVADPVVINMLKASKNDIQRRASTNSSTGSSTGSPTKVVAIDQSIKTTVKEVQHELGEGPWAVDFADSLKLLPDKLRRTHEARYFLPVHCQLCKGIDHVTDRCPDQEKPENVVCYLCGDRDHWASKCQYKFCSLCNTIGHFSSHCKNISKVRGQFCKRCNQRGHVVAVSCFV
uniref:CCHC-type domain-containing protein n=1 Tax=Plectus sambesii TaxID=2011161 RepID=A0A914UZZ8_9BILA